MTETHKPENISLYLPVDKRNITAKTVSAGILTIEENPTPNMVKDRIRDYSTLEELLLQLESVNLSENLKKGISAARQVVNNIRERMSLPRKAEEDMKVAYLPQKKFNDFCKRFSLDDKKDIWGFASGNLSTVAILASEDLPEYFTASNACHELTHRFLEQHVRVYASAERTKTDDTKYTHRLLTEPRRSGLSVDKIGYDKSGNLIKRGASGVLLNEISNYILQKAYLEMILGNASGLFEDEVTSRRYLLAEYIRKLGGHGDFDNMILSFTANDKRVILHSSNIHFDAQGQPLFLKYAGPFLAMQLGSDLAQLCGGIDGRHFGEALIEAKLKPGLQGKIRKRVDEKIGNGFYARLKKAEINGDNIATLLSEVQQKLYTD